MVAHFQIMNVPGLSNLMSLGDIFDVFTSVYCHNLTLPSGVTAELVNEVCCWLQLLISHFVIFLFQVVTAQSWLTHFKYGYPEYESLVAATLLIPIRDQLNDFLSGSGHRFVYWSAHDSTVNTLLSGLQV